MRRGEAGAARRLPLRILISTLAAVLYLFLLWQVSGPLIAWIALAGPADADLGPALKYDGGNATYHYMAGRKSMDDFAAPDPEKAVAHYRDSLMKNPLQPGVWMEAAKAYRDLGKAAEAEHAFERAVRLSPNNAELMWEAGSFWLMNNMTEKALGALRQAIITDPSRQVRVYDLCWKLGLGNDLIMAELLPGSYPHQRDYLKYLLGAKRYGQAEQVWNSIDRDELEKEVFLSYVNQLISGRHYDKAWSAWQEITGMLFGEKALSALDESLIWNRSFEQEILNGGFDWTIREAEGVDVFIDDSSHMTGSRSLGVVFDGRHNPDIVFAQQVVPVSPGAQYLLRAQIKTDSLTTSNGVFLQVRGHDCQGIDRKSEVLTGSNFWREVSVSFETPSHCNAATVMIRRERSQKLDNKIGGTAWIDGVTLKQQNRTGTNSSIGL